MKFATVNDRDAFVEDLAAEFTNAAYSVVLRHGVGPEWLSLQLDLWKAVTETVERLERTEMHCVPRGGTPARISDFLDKLRP